jgi:hypothetical protein
VIIAHHDAHGHSYEVSHADGTIASYDSSEVEEFTETVSADAVKSYASILLKHMQGIWKDNLHVVLNRVRFVGSSHTGIYEMVPVLELADQEFLVTDASILELQQAFATLATDKTKKFYTIVGRGVLHTSTHILWEKSRW